MEASEAGKVEIRTERLLLRRARIGDLADIHSVLGDPRATRYWSTPPHADLEESRAWLDSMIHAPADASDDFVIQLGDRVIGKAGCWRLPEIGYILHPDFWGRGYASEALRAVLDHIFRRPEVDRIIADVDPRNQASLRLLERLGFRETGRARGTWHVNGEICDSLYLALDRLPAEGTNRTGGPLPEA